MEDFTDIVEDKSGAIDHLLKLFGFAPNEHYTFEALEELEEIKICFEKLRLMSFQIRHRKSPNRTWSRTFTSQMKTHFDSHRHIKKSELVSDSDLFDIESKKTSISSFQNMFDFLPTPLQSRVIVSELNPV